ncbi:MAG TPA: SRPBCC domain-containing protein [Patescibacteria group bacterium]|nr:SRPBCC domain-containing protein [Patescibacteria group bacterium]
MSREIVVEHAGRVVRAEIRTTASAEQAWQAWAEPARLSEWFTDRAKGRAAVGGTVTWYFDRFKTQFPYDVIAAEPGARLVLKGSPPGRPAYLLEIQVSGQEGGALVRLINSGFSVGVENDEEHEGVLSGWQMALAILKHYLENHFGQPKAAFFAMQPAPLEYERILHYFLEEEGLMRWLTSSGEIGEPGARYALTLRDGSPMSGRVLAKTSREVAVSWDEIDGVAEFKAFRIGPRSRAVAVRGCGWNLDEDRAVEIDRMLSKAIDRLVAAL